MNNVAVAVDVVEDLGQTGDGDGVVVEEHAKITKRPAPPTGGPLAFATSSRCNRTRARWRRPPDPRPRKPPP